MKEFWHLDHINLYNILCPTKLKGHEDAHGTAFKKGELIYAQDDHSQRIYLVSKGKVKLVTYTPEGEEIVKVILKKGELFGEKALLGFQSRDEYAVADSKETHLCPLTSESMSRLMRKDERFELYIYKLIGFRMKRMERRLEILFFKDVKTRLIEFLKDLITEHYETTKEMPPLGPVKVPLTFSQSDIASLIGSSRETVAKTMSSLKKEGLINYSRNSLTVTQLTLFAPSLP